MAFNEFYMQSGGSNLNAGSTNSNTAAYTSASGNFDGTSVFTPTDSSTPASSVSVGDWVSIFGNAAATTAFVAQVTAVGAGTNGTITVSTTIRIGSVPGVSTGTVTLRAGGAWADLGVVGSLFFAQSPLAFSMRVNVKAATYANTTNTRTFACPGAAGFPLWWRGYKTTIGDMDGDPGATARVAGTDIPSWTFTTGQLVLSGAHQNFSNIDIQSACVVTNGAVQLSGNPGWLDRCRVTNTAAATNARALAVTGAAVVSRCYLQANAAADRVVHVSGSGATLFTNEVVGGTEGVVMAASSSLIGNLIVSPASHGIDIASGTTMTIAYNTVYNPGGDAIHVTTAPGLSLIANNLLGPMAATFYGFNNASTGVNAAKRLGNSIYVGSGAGPANNWGDAPVLASLTEAATPYTNAGSGDYTPKTTSSAYQKGQPIHFENATLQTYASVGAVQPQGATSGGGLPPRPYQLGF